MCGNCFLFHLEDVYGPMSVKSDPVLRLRLYFSGVPGGDVIFCSLSSVVALESICHSRHYKMDGSPVNCWVKQMVKTRKDKRFQVCRGQTTGKHLELKSRLSSRGIESRDGPVSVYKHLATQNLLVACCGLRE